MKPQLPCYPDRSCRQARLAFGAFTGFLLWAYEEAPNLVRSAAPGDTSRSAYVGEVLGNFDKVLLIHQEGQDLFMYPQLAERAPASASHVEQMLDQHNQIRERVQSIEPGDARRGPGHD